MRIQEKSSRCSSTALSTALLGLDVPSAHAGPCSKNIEQFEKAVRQSACLPARKRGVAASPLYHGQPSWITNRLS